MADEIDFTETYVDFVRAGVDQNFTMFKLYTRKLHDHKTGEVGQFDMSCKRPYLELESNSDPVGYLKRLARAYLSHCVGSTGVELDKWIIEFSPLMERFQVPSHLFLDTARDRAWLK